MENKQQTLGNLIYSNNVAIQSCKIKYVIDKIGKIIADYKRGREKITSGGKQSQESSVRSIGWKWVPTEYPQRYLKLSQAQDFRRPRSKKGKDRGCACCRGRTRVCQRSSFRSTLVSAGAVVWRMMTECGVRSKGCAFGASCSHGDSGYGQVVGEVGLDRQLAASRERPLSRWAEPIFISDPCDKDKWWPKWSH